MALKFHKSNDSLSICHVHPNNCCGNASLDGIEIPRVIEVTFIRNDLVDEFTNGDRVLLPHPLDFKNVDNHGDITMPIQWWNKEKPKDLS